MKKKVKKKKNCCGSTACELCQFSAFFCKISQMLWISVTFIFTQNMLLTKGYFFVLYFSN